MVDQARPGRVAEAETPDAVVERVRALVELAARHRLAELKVEVGDFKLSLRARPAELAGDGAPPAPATTGDGATAVAAPDGHLVTAPMIGTFYASPAPGEPPFVAVGDTVEAGQTVAIIEAMKIMNEVQADAAGRVAEVLARNGQGVEFGQPLLRLEPR